MSKMALSALGAFIVCFLMVGCGGQLEGSSDDNAILGNGQGPGVAQGSVGEGDGDCDGEGDGDGASQGEGDGDGDCDGEGTPEGAGDGECDGDGDGVPQGDSQADCEAGYVPCACEDKAGDGEPSGGDGEKDQVDVVQYPVVEIFASTGTSAADAAKEADCCCLAE